MAENPRVYSYIRMSTPRQQWGDSLRRQDEAAQAYVKDKGWDLLEQDQLRDIGVSAFRGKHIEGGTLGRFLVAIREGTVKKGSVLLVEALDRLDRREPMKALGTFAEIINRGIIIHTLSNKKTYDQQTGVGDLIVTIVEMGRANDESEKKSYRYKSLWVEKRRNAAQKILTGRCPPWLRLLRSDPSLRVSQDKTKWEVIRERANIVRRIYRDSAAGLGDYTIMTKLNRDRVPVFGKSKGGWHNSTVNEILTNRAVLGEFQPHRLVDGKREPVGPLLKNYYPRIIDDDLFYRVQAAREQRRVKGAGRKGKHLSNLFSGLAHCAYCDAPMRFINKGNGRRGGGQYLICDKAIRGLGCEKTTWRYRDFEASFLAFVNEVNVGKILRADVGADLDAEIDALRGRLATIKTQEDRVLQLFIDTPDAEPDSVRERLGDFQQERAKLEAEIKTKDQARINAKAEAQQAHEIKADIARLQQTNGDDELYTLRAKVASRLKTIVQKIEVAPAGHIYIRDYLETIKHQPESAELREYLERRLQDEPRRFFVVTLKDGLLRQVYPSDDDPMQYVEQIVSDKDRSMVLTPKPEEWMRRRGLTSTVEKVKKRKPRDASLNNRSASP
jgi:DNA invertase Pin-like site-specific DNA recombinase